MAITALGATPWKPKLPKITSTIGAIASTGTVCEATIHGSKARSSVRECTIATASNKPKAVPMTNPHSVDSPVTATCSNRLRGESMGQPVRLAHKSAAT